jgi:hypothetical protein
MSLSAGKPLAKQLGAEIATTALTVTIKYRKQLIFV